ncbi:HNH endonuclease family protein [Photobacterium nomapromontoriensis]|uniref:HNH endonuclease family protein n=1 Tax=Photobacterium nomapromontoriensis TaxID=2910237 RepID=UPI003D0AFBD2
MRHFTSTLPRHVCYGLALALLLPLTATAHAMEPLVVKKSTSGICHDSSSASYQRTKTFTPYDNLTACLNSGGRLPKGSQAKKSITTANHTSYQRQYFGHGWLDNDKDCQNARMETLIAQSVGQVRFKSDKQCQVVSGRWNSAYSGKTIYQASDIDIDHIVPLKWAWEHGANTWTTHQRKTFANDPKNLVSVEASLNRQKGAKGLDEWLPPKNQCQYIPRFMRVVKAYRLTLSHEETVHYQALLARCKKTVK